MALEFRLVGAAIFFLALAFLAGGWTMALGTVNAPGPGLAPLLLAAATAITAGLTAVMPVPAAALDERPATSLKALAICAILGLVILAFEPAGFVVSTFAGVFLLLRVVERQSWVLSLAVAAALSGGCYLLFARALRIALP